ncbi:MAG: hypothetical protein WC670_00035 [Pseudolabrys sp.]|jgi:hypothetical protein
MKTPKVLTDVEHQAARQLNLLMRAARKQYDRFVATSSKSTTAALQRRYIRSVEQTIVNAEKIIAELKPRVAAVKRSISGAKRKAKRKVTRATPQTRRRSATGRGTASRKTKL